jgi:hypothetical protein
LGFIDLEPSLDVVDDGCGFGDRRGGEGAALRWAWHG